VRTGLAEDRHLAADSDHRRRMAQDALEILLVDRVKDAGGSRPARLSTAPCRRRSSTVGLDATPFVTSPSVCRRANDPSRTARACTFCGSPPPRFSLMMRMTSARISDRVDAVCIRFNVLWRPPSSAHAATAPLQRW